MSTDIKNSGSVGGSLTLKRITKQFSNLQVLKSLDLSISAGEFVAIVGRSGCGKSTLLRLLAGLDYPTSGDIKAEQKPLQDFRDEIRLMFQDDRLLPWKRVIDNVGLGLSGNWKEKAQIALEEVGLSDKADVWPAQLSGGQRQRVALARALIHQPRILLLDEPLGALDALTRLEMQQLIERLWLQHNFTVVLVTHDVTEAVLLADRVIVLEEGCIGIDKKIPLARSRNPAHPAVTTLSGDVLNHVLGLHKTANETSTSVVNNLYPLRKAN